MVMSQFEFKLTHDCREKIDQSDGSQRHFVSRPPPSPGVSGLQTQCPPFAAAPDALEPQPILTPGTFPACAVSK
jgi:hypothetical protein